MGVHKCVACDIFCKLDSFARSRFLTFLRLSVQRGIVDPQAAGDEDAVCRNLIAGLQEHLVSYNYIIHINHCHQAISVYLAFIFFCTVF